jgi:short-subunit dehydrogenase
MKAQRSGKLALISSTSGHHAPGDLTAYAPSKWALESLCAALRSELRGHGVALDSASLTTLRNRHSEVFTTDSGLDPERTAAVIARRMERPTGAAYFHPRRYRGVHWLERLAPGVLDARAGLGSGRRVRFRAMALRRGLITGASSGLGRELARLYAARLEELWLVARSGGALAALGRELEAAHGCRIHPRVVDMADLPAVAALADELDGIDLLVNNAGARLEGETDATPLELVERVYATNFLGAVRLTGRLLERGRLPAKVVNVLSTTAVAGRRRLGAYGGSKAALWCFTRSLRRVAGNDHQVLEVVPATFASSLFEKGIRIDAPGSPPTRTPPSARRLEARAVAERIAAAEAAGRERLFVPGEARLFLWLEALAPPLFRRLFP